MPDDIRDKSQGKSEKAFCCHIDDSGDLSGSNNFH